MDWAQTNTLGIAIWGSAYVFAALAFVLAIPWGIWMRIQKRGRQNPSVIARVEALPSLRAQGSYRAIRIILKNKGGTKTNVEEIIFCRRPAWFEFGIIGPLVRLNGLSPWRLNVGIASRGTVRFPIILDVDGLWESVIPLELEHPDNKEELQRLERYSEAVKVLPSGAMRYSIQLSYPTESRRSLVRRGASHTNVILDGWVSLASN